MVDQSVEGIMSFYKTLNTDSSKIHYYEIDLVPFLTPLSPLASSAGRFFACPTGWERYKNGCYLYSTTGRSWQSAAVILININITVFTMNFSAGHLNKLTC